MSTNAAAPDSQTKTRVGSHVTLSPRCDYGEVKPVVYGQYGLVLIGCRACCGVNGGCNLSLMMALFVSVCPCVRYPMMQMNSSISDRGKSRRRSKEIGIAEGGKLQV